MENDRLKDMRHNLQGDVMSRDRVINELRLHMPTTASVTVASPDNVSFIFLLYLVDKLKTDSKFHQLRHLVFQRLCFLMMLALILRTWYTFPLQTFFFQDLQSKQQLRVAMETIDTFKKRLAAKDESLGRCVFSIEVKAFTRTYVCIKKTRFLARVGRGRQCVVCHVEIITISCRLWMWSQVVRYIWSCGNAVQYCCCDSCFVHNNFDIIICSCQHVCGLVDDRCHRSVITAIHHQHVVKWLTWGRNWGAVFLFVIAFVTALQKSFDFASKITRFVLLHIIHSGQVTSRYEVVSSWF